MSTEPSTPLTITMTSWEWHALLSDLEEHMRIINRNQEQTYALYEIIASQLAGHPVKIRRPEPPKPAPTLAEPVVVTEGGNWFSRLFGRADDPGTL